MRGIKRISVVVVLAALFVLVLVYLLTPRAPGATDWKLITVSFGGYTNMGGAPTAALRIQNQTGSAIKVMDNYYIEWPGMYADRYGGGMSNNAPWAATVTNHIIGDGQRIATGTNLVVRAHQTGVLIIPVPSQGNRWLVSLEFARANLQTQLGEYLQKPHGAWVNYVPPSLRSLYIIRSASCEFSADAR